MVMKLSPFISVITILVCLFLFSGSGCTNIDNPIREEVLEALSIVADKYTILDTESVILEAVGGVGLIQWDTVPALDGAFSPETGPRVLFSPPDVAQKTTITIISKDETERHVQILITVEDEGPPPQAGDVLINEIAWAGTVTSSYDEYIELINRSSRPFYLSGWKIENAAGTGNALTFSGRIEALSTFLITNYNENSEKTAITARIDYSDSALSIPNSTFGPFILKNQEDEIFDNVGDGNSYTYGFTGDIKSSLSRYTYSTATEWNIDSWYTEGISLNLKDETFGTPGAANSDTPYQTGPSEDDALALITEYHVDAHDEIGEDWIELFITKSGNIKNLVITDLDAGDSSITNGLDVYREEGEFLLVVWSDSFGSSGNVYYIPDTKPPGTKDELVLLCQTKLIDGLCYSVDGNLPDDYEKLCGFGWEGDPVGSLHASRIKDVNGDYNDTMNTASWDIEAAPTPGI
ncbi:MAG: lamin tail domain-containing protein [Spirochaetota bacterium]|nr:MAG: lamin tail domain-containing protein [Spirochaetota bacterium]